MNIKEKLKSIPKLVKKVLEKFPITILAILLFTVFLAIAVDNKIIGEKILENIMFFTLYFVPGSFLIETLLNKNNEKKIFSYVIVTIVSIVLTVFQNKGICENILWKISVCYVVTLLNLSIYFLFKKSELSFKEYLVKVYINIIKASVIYVVLAIGIAIVLSIFVYLIWEKIGYTLIYRLEIILLGFYYIPKLMYCLVDNKGEVNKFFKGLIKYVLSSLVILSFIIIYMYIVKILVLRDMPKNQIFRILSALFIIGMPIWTMAQHFKDESLLYKVNLKLPVAFIPFIFLQIYTIGIRIIESGITPLRYLCVALIIFEIIYILVYILKKEKIEVLLLVFNVILIISIIVPGINMFTISNISQAQKLKFFKDKFEYTTEERQKIYGAYKYLKDSEGGEKYINKILTEEEIKEVETLKINDKKRKVEYIYLKKKIGKIEVNEYKNLYFIGYNSKDDNNSNKNIEQAFKNISLKVDNSAETLNVDLSNEIKEYININNNSGKETLDNYFESKNEIKLDNNKKLIIKSLTIYYNQDLEEVETYSISGYLLEK